MVKVCADASTYIGSDTRMTVSVSHVELVRELSRGILSVKLAASCCDTPRGEIPNGGGNGAVSDAKTSHGFASSHPNISMFDTKTMQMIKSIDPNEGNPAPNPQFSSDGIYFDESDGRVYIGSHPTKELI